MRKETIPHNPCESTIIFPPLVQFDSILYCMERGREGEEEFLFFSFFFSFSYGNDVICSFFLVEYPLVSHWSGVVFFFFLFWCYCCWNGRYGEREIVRGSSSRSIRAWMAWNGELYAYKGEPIFADCDTSIVHRHVLEACLLGDDIEGEYDSTERIASRVGRAFLDLEGSWAFVAVRVRDNIRVFMILIMKRKMERKGILFFLPSFVMAESLYFLVLFPET